MAIEKTYFTGTTGATNCVEVLSWLQSNATDYFDEISGTDDNTKIYCKIGSVNALTFDFGTERIFTITLNNGNTYQSYTTWSSNDRWRSASKTDNGIFLYSQAIDNLFISKTTNNNIFSAFVMKSGASNHVWRLVDFTASPNSILSDNISNATLSDLASGVYATPRTALVPVISSGDTYCNSLFFVPFTQYITQSDIIIDIDGTKYVYNGIFALKE